MYLQSFVHIYIYIYRYCTFLDLKFAGTWSSILCMYDKWYVCMIIEVCTTVVHVYLYIALWNLCMAICKQTNQYTYYTPWKINMEPSNHQFRKENDLPNLHDYVPCQSSGCIRRAVHLWLHWLVRSWFPLTWDAVEFLRDWNRFLGIP